MSASACRGSHERGFTLIEVMAVVLLLALLAGVAIPAFGRGGAADAENDAKQIGAAVEYARRSALISRDPHRLVLDLRGARWWLEHDPQVVADAEEGEIGELPTWADVDELPLAPPATTSRGFQAVSGFVGEGALLRRTVRFAGAETADGWLENGTVAIGLRPDGTADRTVLVLEADNGERVLLTVEPIDETVRIRREGE